MDPVLYTAYALQFQTYRSQLFRPPEFRDLDVYAAITDVAKDLKLESRLRPDAALFLMINLDQMVVRPLSYRSRSSGSKVILEGGEIQEMIRDDIRSILSEAQKYTKDEISAHSILNVIRGLWDSLRTSRLEVWG
ncbi:MAG: hypothetical protein LAP21_02910 [Acidobacteriia bacterium]|nr:hypothetical protein [Terriglobia bacterium]